MPANPVMMLLTGLSFVETNDIMHLAKSFQNMAWCARYKGIRSHAANEHYHCVSRIPARN